MSFLNIFRQVMYGGVVQPLRANLNFIGPFTVTDNPTNNSLDITATVLAAPTGTGFVHLTGGAVDAAARAVNLGTADVTGTLPVTALSTGTDTYVLTMVSGVPTWAANANGITGTGLWYSTAGVLHSAAITLSGDVGVSALSGNNLPVTVSQLHGASVPNGTSLTIGNVLQATGSSTLSYGPVNLAGGSNYVTGTLPLTNFSHGTDAQVLVTNIAGTAASWVSFAGDVTNTASGTTTVGNITGATVAGPAKSVNVGVTGQNFTMTMVASSTLVGFNIIGAFGIGGASSSTPGGVVTITSGDAVEATSGTAAGADGGVIEIFAGHGADGVGGTSAGGNSGNVHIQAFNGGTAAGGGTAGNAGIILLETTSPLGGNQVAGAIKLLSSSDDSSRNGSVQLSASTYLGIEAATVGVGSPRLAAALCSRANGQVTTTQLPANTGDGVVFIWNCHVAPSSGTPVGGGILYVSGGALRYKGTSGTDTPIAPA